MAEPCTDDMEPFMKTCRALCMVLWPSTDKPVSGSAKPEREKEHAGTFGAIIPATSKQMHRRLH